MRADSIQNLGCGSLDVLESLAEKFRIAAVRTDIVQRGTACFEADCAAHDKRSCFGFRSQEGRKEERFLASRTALGMTGMGRLEPAEAAVIGVAQALEVVEGYHLQVEPGENIWQHLIFLA